MSQLLERAVRRQRALQQSYSTAWALFVGAVLIGLGAIVSVVLLVRQGAAVSLSGFVSAAVAIAAFPIAVNIYREARRLGRLLGDPQTIMLAKQNPDLDSGLNWSSLNPFSAWRG